jgi:hypothetical protein
VDHREAICIPGGVRDWVEGAVDDGIEFGRLGVREIPTEER